MQSACAPIFFWVVEIFRIGLSSLLSSVAASSLWIWKQVNSTTFSRNIDSLQLLLFVSVGNSIDVTIVVVIDFYCFVQLIFICATSIAWMSRKPDTVKERTTCLVIGCLESASLWPQHSLENQHTKNTKTLQKTVMETGNDKNNFVKQMWLFPS